MRRIHRSDLSMKSLVQRLRTTGIRVYHIGRPCDLLLYFWCNRHHDFCWQTLECKTPMLNGKMRKRLDQPKQQVFLEDTRTPIATTFDEAWVELNKRHRISGVDVSNLVARQLSATV